MRRLSGNNLTVIIVAAMLCLALPVTAIGAQVSKVAIAGKNGKTAKVKSGKLQVGGSVVVGNTVTTQTSSPKAQYQRSTFELSNGCKLIAQAPAASGLMIETIHVNIWSLAGPASSRYVAIYRTPDCGDGAIAAVNPTTLGVTQLTFPSGLPVAAGKRLYAKAGDMSGETYVFGYKLPASQVPNVAPLRPSGARR